MVLGMWAMLHEPIHLITFLVVLTIIPILIYTGKNIFKLA